jgi:hypothetical protein
MKQLFKNGIALLILGVVMNYSSLAHSAGTVITSQPIAVPVQAVQAAPSQPEVQAAGPAQAQSQTTVQPIYIVNPAPQSNGQVQPVTQVEAQTVRESRLEQIRKQREEIERQTEEKIQQRIEDDRIQSEKDRQDRLLGTNPLPAPSATPAKTTTVIVQEKPAVVEVIATTAPTPVPTPAAAPKVRVGGLLGVGSYPTVSNVSPVYSAGFTVDYLFPERVAVEGAFSYSSFDVTNVAPCYYCSTVNLETTMNQMNFTAGATYAILPSKITPVVGALVGYTRRSYTGRVTYNNWGGANNSSISSSNAFDAGLITGAELTLSDKFTIGANIKWFWNMSYRTDDAMAYSYGPPVGSPIESLNYYLATISFKLSL